MNISWDLKNNKTVTYQTAFEKVSDSGKFTTFFKSGKVTMKNYKITKAGKSGYKKLTFDLVYELPVTFSTSEVDGLINLTDYYGTDSVSNYHFFTVVDYDSGECLEIKNSKNVTVKSGGFKYSNIKRTYGTGGNWVQFNKDVTVSITITYPSNYKNMCIVAGGNSIYGDDLYYGSYYYFKGSTTFVYASNLYGSKDAVGKSKMSKYKNIAHAIRVK